MRTSWAIWVISGSICGYIFCFSAIILVDHRNSRESTYAPGERGSGQHAWVSDSRKLAVVVPTHDGDIARAVVSMKRWPTTCSTVTLSHVDLIVYHATNTDPDSILARVPDEAMMCFRSTKVVSANLTAEENVYPIGPSVQFYRIFLDQTVASKFVGYDAIAIVEWDVVVAHDSSFHRLHEAAFANSEPFWVKGSTLAGTEFHETAVLSDMWFILGHLNGNAIYNNSDPAFAEFVDYTYKRWKYDYPYDVALWASLSDFPYSWPLWQRFAQKFVSTKLISNVGFHDVGKEAVEDAIAADTLFIHGSTKGGGSTTWANRKRPKQGIDEIDANSCQDRCGKPVAGLRRSSPTSTVCDATCRVDEYGDAGRFGGYLCGAGDPAKFGSACRTCFVDHEAALTEDWHLESDFNPGTFGKHVIMCDTLRPPQAIDCSAKCARQVDTICDQRCGSGHLGDLHCNWRGMGPTCRFCFNDPIAARLADTIASTRGERVIMCDTHEPPTSSMLYAPVNIDSGMDEAEPKELPRLDEEEHKPSSASEDLGVSEAYKLEHPEDTVFTKDITRGQICAFVPGYFEFLGETRVTIASVLHFMPGMRVIISTSELDFHVFNNTVGYMPGVKVLNSSHVDIAATMADEMCGEGTRLIYYLSPGQVLSREFTAKDTHALSGDLVVIYTAVEDIGKENALRAMATTTLLGYHAPSFTYGTDLILPVETNIKLRGILLSAAVAEGKLDGSSGDKSEVEVEFEVIRAYMSAMNTTYSTQGKRFIPEVLAATAFYHNQEGVTFVNPTEWSHENLFQHVSVWDIPLVKPHFSCMIDLRLGLDGYNVASTLEKWLEAFRLGARCERGFISLDRGELKPKASVEFGPVVGKPMPDIRNYDVSVMYRSFYGDAVLFDVSLPTVIKNFPTAREVVVVVEKRDGDLFRELVAPYRESSPFPIRVVTEPTLMDGHVQQKYSKLRGDIYCKGDYILHLDSDSVVYEPVTYDHIFHMGKPVLPYRRYREELHSGKHLSWCWRNGTSLAVGQDVVHEYSIFNTHVYPRKMYPAIRSFVEERHGVSFASFMASRRGKCMTVKTLSRWTLGERNLLLSDFNLMGAYLWYYMHDAVHWMATDPLDQTPDEWRRDVTRYAWVCQANGRHMPADKEGQEHYIAVLMNVTTFDECVDFQERFTPRVV